MSDGLEPLLMVVEDNEFSRKMMATALNGRRYIFAKTAKEAVASYTQHRPDLVFLDIELPDVSGHKVLKAIRKINPSAYIIMLSANSDKDSILTSVREGARGFITKPFSKAKLDEYIERYVAESSFDADDFFD